MESHSAKQILKRVLRSFAPGRFDALMAQRANRHGASIMAAAGVPEIARSIQSRCGERVLSGPFAGMTYRVPSVGSCAVPKLIGSYESELHAVVRQCIETGYPVIVDVGCAEGYYAVGMARQSPGSTVHAFDIDPEARRRCRQLAEANAVLDRVRIRAQCDCRSLAKVLQGLSLVLCDCEGFELELLDPEKVPALTHADVLVELHDAIRPGITPALLSRFAISHDIEVIRTCSRAVADYPVLGHLTEGQKRVALSEFRNGPMTWAFMQAKSRSALLS